MRAGSCNSRFGHEFEGPVSLNLAPYLVVLALNGVPSRAVVTWKRAFTDDRGSFHDLDTSRRARLSKPIIERDGEGRVSRGVYASRADAARGARRLIASGKAKGVVVTPATVDLIAPNLTPITLSIGPELQRLVVKMCAGLTALQHPRMNPLSAEARSFLLGAPGVPNHVRFPSISYPALDALFSLSI